MVSISSNFLGRTDVSYDITLDDPNLILEGIALDEEFLDAVIRAVKSVFTYGSAVALGLDELTESMLGPKTAA